MYAVARSSARAPFGVAASICIHLDRRRFWAKIPWWRQHVLNALPHLPASRLFDEPFGNNAAAPKGLWLRAQCLFCGVLCRRRLVVELEGVPCLWVGVMAYPLAMVVQVVRVREGLVAVGAVVAAVPEVALPGGVDAVRKDSAGPATLPGRFGELVEPGRLVHIDPVPDIHEVVAVLLASLPPSAISASFEHQVREVGHEGDVPGTVLKGPRCGCDSLDAKLAQDFMDMVDRPCCGPLFGPGELPVVADVLGEVDVEEAFAPPVPERVDVVVGLRVGFAPAGEGQCTVGLLCLVRGVDSVMDAPSGLAELFLRGRVHL